ncbi:deoxyguanosinetriphosphate triphosphohydrolase [Caballeronia sp. GAWG1-1]|uniref:deoxyguanosinetriphosphate triphosphohydrolase n=1 Tax=Caballeronia sp. GAWG1-1 TaxID=2921742 RepID=UPI002028CC33|nr:deoxyguanosinetriphosphate triphosphohydrolase [Caballeronia sp. GAWG1-1]
MKLLSAQRLGAGKQSGKGKDIRSAFVRDYDRLIFSSAFRRLQDKTQVFPLAKSDYVRTRLTHSLEVASVGRSLGTLAGAVIDKSARRVAKVNPQDVGVIVSAACLAHDIGNPPFGHAGESAIQEWFGNDGEGGKRLASWKMSPTKNTDFLKFEGNAQGFRTVARTQIPEQKGGMQLTYATLATFTKYPRESSVPEGQRSGISGKKFGFMQSEKELFEEVAEEVGLVAKTGKGAAWHRHPLAFLVEAADDICYHIMDIEDGFRAGMVTFEELKELHKPWSDGGIEKRLAQPGDQYRQAEYLRARTIGKLIDEFVAVFAKKVDDMMTGSFDGELAAHITHAAEFKKFKQVGRAKVYNSRPVVEVEACGFEVIGGLLSAFVGAMDDLALNKTSASVRSKTLVRLTSFDPDVLAAASHYERAVYATDYISGMTDSYAVTLYQRIRGIALP